MSRKMIAGALIFLLISGCSGIRVKTDYDREADFSLYKTYGWLPDPEGRPRQSLMNNKLVRREVHAAVDREMAKLGFEKVGRMEADLLVTFYIGTKRRVDVTHHGYGYGPWRRPRYGGVSIHRYKEGTLILDFIDAGTRQLIWRGWAASVLHGRENLSEDIYRSVEELMRRYPPEE